MAQNLWDDLFGELSRAATEVREMLVEEPWFGRPVTNGQGSQAKSVAEELGWVKSDRDVVELPAQSDLGHEIER